MEPNLNQPTQSKTPTLVAGLAVGCLGLLVLGACLLVGFIFLVARPDTNNRTPSGSSGQPRSGAQVFESKCEPCHSTGTDPKAGPGMAGLFSPGGPTLPAGVDYSGKLPNGQEITDANVAEWIRTGGKGEIGHMPPIRLGEPEMTALLEYLKTLQK